MNRKIVTILFYFSFCIPNRAQNCSTESIFNIRFSHLTIEDGLANSTVRHIIQDEHGFIWFAALNQLCRYDGYEFKTYKHNPKNINSLSGDRITAIVQIEGNKLLIGSWQKGLDIFNLENNEIEHFRYGHDDSLSIGSNQIGSILIDRQNRIWIGAGNTLNLLDIKSLTFTRYYLPNNELLINSIIQPDNENLWILTSQLNIFKFNIKTCLFEATGIIPEGHKDPLIWKCKFYKDNNGVIWICSVKNGIYRLDPNSGTIENFRHKNNDQFSLSSNEVFDMVEDYENKYWVITDGGGLNYFDYDLKKFYHLSHDPNNPESISNNKCYCILKDKTNIVWVGFNNGGVSYFDPNKKKFMAFHHDPYHAGSISDDIVWSFLRDNEGDVLIGTDRGGLNIFNPEKYCNTFIKFIHSENNPNSIPSNTIIALFQDSRNTIWLGTYNNGLVEFNKNNGTFKTIAVKKNETENPLYPAGNDIWDIAEDSDGNLWLATLRYGVDVFNPVTKKFSHFNTNNSKLSSNQVTAVFRDSKNQIWIGSANGLNLYQKEVNNFKVFKKNLDDPKSLPGDDIRVIFEDKSNDLWIGTEGYGLGHMKQGGFEFINYSEEDGLPSNVIYGILEDENDNLWISSSKGLSKFNKHTQKFINFSKKEGLQSNEFKQNSCLKLPNGYMLFGGIKGFNLFHPDSIKYNEYVPPVMITELLILNKVVDPGNTKSPLKKNISYTKKIILNHKQNVISFKYTSLNFTIPENNQFKYFLEGFDENWHEVGNKREATYTNLNPGEYTFKVIASNNDNVWNKTGTEIKVRIKPPWYKTMLAKISFIAILLILAYSFYKNRINRVKRINEELETKVKSRTKELMEANEELKSKQEEILTQNEEMQQQNEEILAQRDEIQFKSEALEKTYQKIKILNNFGQDLTATLDLETVNEMVYNYVKHLMDCSVFGIGIYSEKTNSITFSPLIEEGKNIPPFESSLNDATSCSAWCYKNQKAIFSNDYKNEFDKYISEIKIRSSKIPEALIYLPLTVKNKKIGIITVQSYHAGAYSENDLETLQTLASYIAIALDNASAYDLVYQQKDELEVHRTQLEKLVQERTKDLEAAKIKAEEADRLKSAFLANMSHEIRTPLNAIVGFSEHIIHEEMPEESKSEIFQIIEENAFSLTKLVNDIIDFSKIEAGEISIHISEVNINQVFKEIYQTHTEEIIKQKRQESLQLIVNIDNINVPLNIMTDSIRFRQILNNLIENAIKYTNKGFVEIGYEKTNQNILTFYVKDTGIGIAKKDFIAIFDRFRKIEEGKTIYRGTGLGLSITKYLVEKLGGKIWVESEPGKGSKFIFTLPLNQNNKNISKIINKDTMAEMENPNWSTKKILIVEDEASNFLVLQSMLKASNVQLIWAKDGEEANDIFIKNLDSIDLVLMDIKLPGKSGIVVAGEFKKIKESIPIIAQTAYALPEEEHRIRQANFNNYIAKPITKIKLINMLITYLGNN